MCLSLLSQLLPLHEDIYGHHIASKCNPKILSDRGWSSSAELNCRCRACANKTRSTRCPEAAHQASRVKIRCPQEIWVWYEVTVTVLSFCVPGAHSLQRVTDSAKVVCWLPTQGRQTNELSAKPVQSWSVTRKVYVKCHVLYAGPSFVCPFNRMR